MIQVSVHTVLQALVQVILIALGLSFVRQMRADLILVELILGNFTVIKFLSKELLKALSIDKCLGFIISLHIFSF